MKLTSQTKNFVNTIIIIMGGINFKQIVGIKSSRH